MSRLGRITADPAVCHGQPVVRGLRYPVPTLLELLASGMTLEEVLADYPDLDRDDLLAALEFGALTAGGQRIDPPGPREVPHRRTVASPPYNHAQRRGHEAIHTSSLPEGNRSTDRQISTIADAQGRIVVSKDADFRNSHLLSGSPRWLPIVTTGTSQTTPCSSWSTPAWQPSPTPSKPATLWS
jgi:uncharacterized protein (DUF433 family)